MRLLLAILMLGFLPLLRAGLVEHFCPDAKDQAAVKKAFDGELVNWLQLLCGEQNYPRTWLPTDGAPVPIEIRGASSRLLTYRELLDTGVLDDDGRPVRIPAPADSTTDLAKWLPKYVAGTFPVESNKDDAQLVRFAVWLAEQKKPELANRVLTVLHQRASAEVRALVESWLRTTCGFKDGGLVVASVYDPEFRLVRSELRPQADADKLRKDREKAAADEFARIKAAMAGRTELLARIEYDLRMFERDFADTDKLKSLEKDRQRLAQQVKDARTNIESHARLAQTHAGDLRAQARCWLDASAEDPRNALYRSRAANLLVEHARLEVKSKRLLQATNEGSLKEALPILKELAAEFPAHAGILLDYAKCVHHAQNFEDARKLYKRVIELDAEGAKGKYGRYAAARLENL